MHIKYWVENLKGRQCSEDPGIGGTTLLKWILKETEWEGVGWIHLAQDKN
jgi:hypothetical protein